MQVPFEPMKLTRRPAPFDHPDWLFQVKWDGVRCVALIEGGRVRIFGRHKRERSGAFPELAGLAALPGGRRFVLDGELIALRDGRPSFHGALERWLASPPPAPSLQARIPVLYMIFDLLEKDGLDLIGRPLTDRQEALASLVRPADHWQVVESFPGTGVALFDAATQRGLEGIVGKQRLSLYQPGIRSEAWVKVKRRQRRLCVVAGYTDGGLVLGAYRAGALHYVGRAGSGLTGEQLRLLREHLPPGPMPFVDTPNLRSRFAGLPREVTWVLPQVTVVIEFGEWTEDGKLRDPVVAGFAQEPPEAATLED